MMQWKTEQQMYELINIWEVAAPRPTAGQFVVRDPAIHSESSRVWSQSSNSCETIQSLQKEVLVMNIMN